MNNSQASAKTLSCPPTFSKISKPAVLNRFSRIITPFATMIKLYNLNNAINLFFASNTSVTRQQCDDFVRSHATDPSNQVIPVQIQGAFSYTVTTGSKLFQFRIKDSRIDGEIMTLAKAAHPEFVAFVSHHETIGTNQPLHIYEMEKLPSILIF